MALKIVGGTSKGRKLKGPKTGGIRPATSRVRKSIFEILGDLSGMKVLDLFAGTGSMGLEALSRGAEEVSFVDSKQASISLLFKNLRTTGFLDRTHILKKSVLPAIELLSRKGKRFDIIFLDPPYDRGLIGASLSKLEKFPLLAAGGQVVCEHSPRETPSFLSGLWKGQTRKYGQTQVSFLQRTEHAL